jgi:hypothetical protein
MLSWIAILVQLTPWTQCLPDVRSRLTFAMLSCSVFESSRGMMLGCRLDFASLNIRHLDQNVQHLHSPKKLIVVYVFAVSAGLDRLMEVASDLNDFISTYRCHPRSITFLELPVLAKASSDKARGSSCDEYNLNSPIHPCAEIIPTSQISADRRFEISSQWLLTLCKRNQEELSISKWS